MTTIITAEMYLKQIENHAAACQEWLIAGDFLQLENLLCEIQRIAAAQLAAPAEPLAAQLAAALAWSLETITECIRPDAEMWEQIDVAQTLVDLAQPSAADRAPFPVVIAGPADNLKA